MYWFKLIRLLIQQWIKAIAFWFVFLYVLLFGVTRTSHSALLSELSKGIKYEGFTLPQTNFFSLKLAANFAGIEDFPIYFQLNFRCNLD